VRVIKAPEPEEATYVANRNYPPVPGDIGEYDSLQDARTGMAAALALQASAGSPLAPVTTANAFARSGKPAAELLVAEAPQALGRVSARIASVEPESESETAPTSLGGLLAQSLKSSTYLSAQSRRRIASLSMERVNQSVWGEEIDESAPVAEDALQDAASTVASEETIDDPMEEAAVVTIAVPAPQPAVRPAASEKTEAKEEKKVEKVVASNEEKDEKPVVRNEQEVERVVAAKEPAPRKRHVRREKQEKVASVSRRSRKSRARDEPRRSRTASVERERVADSGERREAWGGNSGRNTQQLTTMGLRAQSSSTL
jgi:hypothetical protein